MEETNLIVKSNEGSIISSDESIFAGRNSQKFCTMDLTDKENKVKLYNSLQQCDVKINDIKGQVIEMADLFIEVKEVAERDEKTDEVIYDEEGNVVLKTRFRTIIFDTEGKTYVSAAYGIYNSLKQIIPVFGNPSKEEPIKVKVGTKKARNGKDSLILTVEA